MSDDDKAGLAAVFAIFIAAAIGMATELVIRNTPTAPSEDPVVDAEVCVDEVSDEPLVPIAEDSPAPARKTYKITAWKPKDFDCPVCRRAAEEAAGSEFELEWQDIESPYPQWVVSFSQLGWPLFDWHTENGKWWYVSGWRGLESFRRQHTASERR